jgi:hypothetical protein
MVWSMLMAKMREKKEKRNVTRKKKLKNSLRLAVLEQRICSKRTF